MTLDAGKDLGLERRVTGKIDGVGSVGNNITQCDVVAAPGMVAASIMLGRDGGDRQLIHMVRITDVQALANGVTRQYLRKVYLVPFRKNEMAYRRKRFKSSGVEGVIVALTKAYHIHRTVRQLRCRFQKPTGQAAPPVGVGVQQQTGGTPLNYKSGMP